MRQSIYCSLKGFHRVNVLSKVSNSSQIPKAHICMKSFVTSNQFEFEFSVWSCPIVKLMILLLDNCNIHQFLLDIFLKATSSFCNKVKECWWLHLSFTSDLSSVKWQLGKFWKFYAGFQNQHELSNEVNFTNMKKEVFMNLNFLN